MKALLPILLAATLTSFACKKEEPNGNRRNRTDDSSAPTAETGTVPTGETGTVPTGDTAPTIPYDCAALPSPPFNYTELGAPRGYHGLAITPDGYMIGSDGNNLLKVSYYNDVSLFAGNLGTVQGMDWLLDGDLVVADSNRLVRVSPQGAVSTLATDIAAYGVVVAPNGMVFAADRDDVWRIDPETGVKERYVDGQNGLDAQSINFSPDYTKLYMTSNFGYALWEMDIDENFEPTSVPRRLADFGSSYRDGLGVDWCGNLYVPDYGAGQLFRISPGGTVEMIINFNPFAKYGHGIIFGTGVGGWKDDAIYMPQPYDGNTVVEVEIGVPGAKWVP